MNEYKLIDRVVIEVLDTQRTEVSNEYMAAKLREIADQIENCQSGGDASDPDNYNEEVLWEHETPRYHGFKIQPGDKSLIGIHYYGLK